jgi:hypothetical protein
LDRVPVPPLTEASGASPSDSTATPTADPREVVTAQFAGLLSGTGGIDSWLGADTPEVVFDRLGKLGERELTRAELNQLLVLSHEAGLSDAFFRYYWLFVPEHPYDVTKVGPFEKHWIEGHAITSLDHLEWGLRRFYTDALLYFGNVRAGYRGLRELGDQDLREFFAAQRSDTSALDSRGPALPLVDISKDDRYLISEMACKSFDSSRGTSDLRDALMDAYRDHVEHGGGPISPRALLDGSYMQGNYGDRQQQLRFAAEELLDEEIAAIEELEGRLHSVADRFEAARTAALQNTKLYLSMVEELDVYVATSMRTRDDFREIATFCEEVFGSARLQELKVRYFDPTMSAAAGHEDKGLIECLMVKSAKMLIYFAGGKESYGKDAEAAMALSQGKPVIFYCDEEQRRRFYRDVHPLSRLIDFRTGVAVGAMVATDAEEVSELIERTLTNGMEYRIEQPRPGYLRLLERLTESVVRLQTNDSLLRETFWNYYHRDPASPLV